MITKKLPYFIVMIRFRSTCFYINPDMIFLLLLDTNNIFVAFLNQYLDHLSAAVAVGMAFPIYKLVKMYSEVRAFLSDLL